QHRLELLRVVEWIVPQREDPNAAPAVVVRIVGLEPASDGVHLRLARLHRYTRRQPPEPLDPSCRTIVELVAGRVDHRLLRRRQPELHRVSHERAEEFLRRDTDDGMGLAVVVDRRADYRLVAAESVL